MAKTDDSSNTPDVATTSDTAPAENTAAAIQKATDEAEDKGYFGHSPDETPREHYSVAGVTAGKPTPEFTELEHKD